MDYKLKVSENDPLTCLVLDGPYVRGTFKLKKEDEMPWSRGETWHWGVEARDGNNGGGYFYWVKK
jgi:hypothetical protein